MSSIYITNYAQGVVNYRRDNIPSKMEITEDMIKEIFPEVVNVFPMILGLIDEQLVTIIETFHTKENHVESIREIQEHYRN
jgi:hypothetical protein